ncbi:RHS repeat-associated core domain-containing protein [Bacillus sp. FJAT-52991]|uniref:RHS repeat-associated core domain-containing protein n=1 Tax=Bacillus kandeliae TaxID=3129297 RepID=A0ABZ2NCN3_9BACI
MADPEYDAAQQLKTLSIKRGTSNLLSESFDYDENGNIKETTSSQGNRSYTYDELNQLRSETLPDGTIESYEYDAVGNRLKKTADKNGQSETTTYTYNDNNQLTAVNGQSYTYDKSGNRKRDNRFIYEYDAFNELTMIKNLSGQVIATYKYDEQGRRVSKTVNGKTTNYHYDQGIQVLFETDDNGTITAEYSYDQSGFPLTMTKNGQTYYYVLNGHKDVVALTDASGNVVASYKYDAWGNVLSQSGEIAESNPYRYAGYRYDEESNLYYLIARYYQASEGVFLSRDPDAGDINDSKTLNGYNYANNNPIMNYDPDGHLARAVAQILASIASVAMKKLFDYGEEKAKKYLKKHLIPQIKKITKHFKVIWNKKDHLIYVYDPTIKGSSGRLFAIEKGPAMYKNNKTGKKKKMSGYWHYHIGPTGHYQPSWAAPRGYTIIK